MSKSKIPTPPGGWFWYLVPLGIKTAVDYNKHNTHSYHADNCRCFIFCFYCKGNN